MRWLLIWNILRKYLCSMWAGGWFCSYTSDSWRYDSFLQPHSHRHRVSSWWSSFWGSIQSNFLWVWPSSPGFYSAKIWKSYHRLVFFWSWSRIRWFGSEAQRLSVHSPWFTITAIFGGCRFLYFTVELAPSTTFFSKYFWLFQSLGPDGRCTACSRA